MQNQLTVTVAPYLDVIADGLFNASEGGINLRETFNSLFRSIARGIFQLDELRRKWLGDDEVKAAEELRRRIDAIDASMRNVESTISRTPSTGIRVGLEAALADLRQAHQEAVDEFQLLPEAVRGATGTAEERYQRFLQRLEESQQQFQESVRRRQEQARQNQQRQSASPTRRGRGSPTGIDPAAEAEANAIVLDQYRQLQLELASESDRAIQRLQEERDRRLEVLMEAAAIDEEVERNQAAVRLQIEQEFNEEYERLLQERQQLEMGYSRARIEFEKKSRLEQTQTVLGILRGQLSGIERHSKALFRVSKLAASSEALVNTYAGAARALKDYPAPLSYGIAAAVTAFGLARVAAIQSQGFGGRGGSPGGGGSTAGAGAGTGGGVAGALPVAPAREVLDVRITADEDQIFTKRQLARIIDEINEEAGDGRSLSISVV